jgi:hypothetical protein
LFADAAFFIGVFGDFPAEGLVEEMAMDVEGGFDQTGVDFGGIDRPLSARRANSSSGISQLICTIVFWPI